MSNCVGLRNHKYFFLFLVNCTFAAIYGVGASATCLALSKYYLFFCIGSQYDTFGLKNIFSYLFSHSLLLGIKNEQQQVNKAFEKSVVSILVGAVSFMVLLMVGPLAGAHSYYIVNYKTTNERVIIIDFYFYLIINTNF